MKLKIMIMALLLVSAGIGSAVDRLPATEFVGDVDMGGNNITDAKMGQSVPQTVIGPYIWCDYETDGTADEVQINQAIADGHRNIILTGLIYISSNNSIELNQSDIRIQGTAKGWQYPDQCELIADINTVEPMIKVSATGCSIENLYFDGKSTDVIRIGAHGIESTVPVNIHGCKIYSCGGNGINYPFDDVSVGGGAAVSDCFIWNCTGWGVLCHSNDLVLNNLEVGNCSAGSISFQGAGCYLGAGSHVWVEPGAEPLANIYISGDLNEIEGTFIDTFGWMGIYIYGGTYNSIVGCRFMNPMETGSVPILVEADTGASHTLAVGNILKDDSEGSVTYGVNLGDSDNNIIGFNCLGSITGTGGSGNVIDHNNVL